MHYAKYHGLGNDYIVMSQAEAANLTAEQVRRICHRSFGVGSDGILVGPGPSASGDIGLRILNPDGSEAEKSGNGLRIFCRYLWDQGLVAESPFEISTLGGTVGAQVHTDGAGVTLQMGRVSFKSRDIPVAGPIREVLNESISVDGAELRFCAATIGNPHCVVLRESLSGDEAQRWGSYIETDERFPNRTNVQFMQVLSRDAIRIEIWERGAGYTLASGTSSCAAAAVAHKLGLCDAEITVHMPGGELAITIEPDYAVAMTGPVVKVAEGEISQEIFRDMRG